MAFTAKPPAPPAPPPPNVPLVDPATGLAHQAWTTYFAALKRYQDALTAHLAAMAAAIP
jgi:hypothetical protein